MTSPGATAEPPPPPRPHRFGTARALLNALTGGDRGIAAIMIAIVAWYCGTRGIFQGKASGDGFFGFMYLPGLVFHHTFDIAPNVPFWVPYLGHERTGHVANACPVGPIVFWFPPYLIGLGLQAINGLFVALPRPALPGQTAFDFWMAGLGSLFAGLAGVGLLFRLLRRKVGAAAARAGVAGGVLATPIVFYLVTQPLYQHATAFFCVTLFVERWDAMRTRGPLGPRQLLILGALGGFAMDMRIQEAVFLLLPGFDVARQIARAIGRRDARAALRHLGGGALLAVAALVAFAPQLALWHWYFGSFRTPQPAGHMRWHDPAIVAALFSTRAGLFPWMPIFYLVLPGLWLGRRALGSLAGLLAIVFAVELWVNAAAWDHWGSWAFGPRRFSDAVVTYAAGVAGLYHAASERARGAAWRRLVLGTVAFFVAFNVLLAELVRQQRLKSSGAYAYPASQWIAFARGPRWLGRVFDTIGYPFVQPAGWIFALRHRAPVNAFEGIVGNYLDERDSRVHAVVHVRGFQFSDFGPWVVEGIAGRPAAGEKRVPVHRRVRVLVPMFASEPVTLSLNGDFGGHEAEVRAMWNGVALQSAAGREQVRFNVPQPIVRSRADTNEVVFELPPDCRLAGLELQSGSDWWR